MCSSVTFEIVNDVASNEVTFRFSSATQSEECVYSEAFDDTDFVYGLLPDPSNSGKDDIYIHSITVTS